MVLVLLCTGIREVGGQAVLGRQNILPTPWLTERHGYVRLPAPSAQFTPPQNTEITSICGLSRR